MMLPGGRTVTRVAACLLAFVVLIPACRPGDSQSSSGDGNVPRELLDRLNSHCTDLVSPSLGEGTLCVDSGFRLKVDDFAFANYGRDQAADANVTVQTMIDLFGHAAVCMPGNQTSCVLRPTTMQKLEEWNNALTGGRCEGFATLSTRFQLGLENPNQYRTDATRVVDLRKNDGRLQSSIVYWWTTQFLREVSDRAGASRQKSPLVLVDDLIQGIANRVGYTLAIYSATQGHSVTPFAVTRRGSAFVIHVYDNNFPGVRKEIMVDSETDTWTYKDAAPDADGATERWGGGSGTIELTPMSARQGPFDCPFCNVSAIPTGAPSTISLASRDSRSPGYLRIVTRSGAVLEATPDGVTNTIPGAVYSMSKGSAAGLSSVSIPGDIGDLDVEIRRGSGNIPAGDVVLTVQRPGAASVQVSGNLATTVAGTKGSGNPIVTLRGGDTTVSTPPGQRARVSLAAGSNLSRAVLEPGQSLTVTAVRRDSIDIVVTGSDGSSLGSTSLDTGGAGDTNVVTLTPDPGTKSLSVTSASVSPVPVTVSSSPTAGSTTSTTTPDTKPSKPRPSKPKPNPTTTSVPSIEITEPSRSANGTTTTSSPAKDGSSATSTTSTTQCPGQSCENHGNSDGGNNAGG